MAVRFPRLMEHVTGAPGTDVLYDKDDADWSPVISGFVDTAQAVPSYACNDGQNPLASYSVIPAGFIPRPPDPAVGGKAGLTKFLAWSTGLRNTRAFRQAFDGRTLRVSNMGPHPIQGPVGYSTRSDRLFYGVQNLKGSGTPSSAAVQDDMASPKDAAIFRATRGNPNYG